MAILSTLKRTFRVLKYAFPLPRKFGYKSKTSIINYPVMITNSKKLFLHDYSKIQPYCKFIMGDNSKVVIKKFSVFAPGVLVVDHNHVPTVGIPHIFNGEYHIHDNDKDIIVEEDCWVGANASLLPGAHLGRGCIIGAAAVVNREVPPYAVVVGIPGKVIGAKFSIDDIIKHEEEIYKPEERYSRSELESIFEEYFKGKKVLYGNQNVQQGMTERWNSIKCNIDFSHLS